MLIHDVQYMLKKYKKGEDKIPLLFLYLKYIKTIFSIHMVPKYQ